MMTYTKKAQSGRSMIEMLGVLAIVGVLSAGGIAGYSMAMQSYKTTSLIEKVNLIAQRTRTTFKGTYTSATNANMTSAGKLSANDFTNPFGGTLTLANSGNTAFTITTTAVVPAEACVDLLTTDWGSTGVFTSVVSNGATVTPATYSSTPTATILSKCSGGNKTVVFTFK